MITAPMKVENVLAMPLAQRNEAAQFAVSNAVETADTVELSEELQALLSVESLEGVSGEDQSLMTGEAASAQYDVSRHAGMISTTGAVPTFVDVSNSYTEARIAAMPSAPTVEDVREVIQRRMTRAADEAFFRGDQQSGAVKHSTIAAQMGVATPHAVLDVQTLQSVQSVSTVQPVPRASGYAGYKPMSSRAVSSTAQSSIRVTA